PVPTPTATATPTATPVPSPTPSPSPSPTPTATPPPTATPTPTPTATPTLTPTPSPTPPPTPRPPTPTPTRTPATIPSDILDFTLQNLSVRVGDTIRWTNRGAATHTSTSGQNGVFDGAGWDSPLLGTGQTFSHTLTRSGSFLYTCRVHPFMNATVTVAP
ncbi:MAG: hypothetical protein HY535_07335, partial [Chloroflexi bacterium]|nr:hypothetical protein [Chloroflexota bacterium]